MEIRQLTADDLFKLSEIVEKVSADLAEKLVNEISDKQMGFQILITIAKYVPTEIKSFSGAYHRSNARGIRAKKLCRTSENYESAMERRGLPRFFGRNQINAKRNFCQIIDLIQARYGWHDQILFDLPAARFLQICSTVIEAYEREHKDRYIQEAYNAWQIIEVVKGIMSDNVKGMNFNEYLKRMNLLEKEKRDPLQTKNEQKKALSIADQIKQLDTQQGSEGIGST